METAAGLEDHYLKFVASFNTKFAEPKEEHKLKMAANLKAGRESYREELREEYGKKCKMQERRFAEKKSRLKDEKKSLEQNLRRVRQEQNDEKSARRRAAEEVERLRGELDSLRAQVAPVAEQVAERRRPRPKRASCPASSRNSSSARPTSSGTSVVASTSMDPLLRLRTPPLTASISSASSQRN